jgi:hypothetical protein
MDSRLHAELWTSWASLLRSYAAAHGLNSTHHAVVEVSADEITLRVGSRWLRFTESTMQYSGLQKGEEAPQTFALHEDGTVSLNGGPQEEMDIVAEQIARGMMQE